MARFRARSSHIQPAARRVPVRRVHRRPTTESPSSNNLDRRGRRQAYCAVRAHAPNKPQSVLRPIPPSQAAPLAAAPPVAPPPQPQPNPPSSSCHLQRPHQSRHSTLNPRFTSSTCRCAPRLKHNPPSWNSRSLPRLRACFHSRRRVVCCGIASAGCRGAGEGCAAATIGRSAARNGRGAAARKDQIQDRLYHE